MTHVRLAAAATEAVSLFAIPENAAKLQAAQNECKSFDLLLALGIFLPYRPIFFLTGAGDIGKFFMLCIPIATEILGQVQKIITDFLIV